MRRCLTQLNRTEVRRRAREPIRHVRQTFSRDQQSPSSPSLVGISSAASADSALNVVFFRHSYCLNANAYSELPAFIATY